jgi:hypothetical protein
MISDTDRDRLTTIGDTLQDAVAGAIARGARTRRSTRRRVVIVAVCAAAALPAAVMAADVLLPGRTVATYLPRGAAIWIDTDPTCTAVRDGLEYRCVLARAPFHATTSPYRGAIENTVGDDQRINGACIGTSDDGLRWECYLGDAAVDAGIMERDVLGAAQTEPAAG